jgi:hypothetical protein
LLPGCQVTELHQAAAAPRRSPPGFSSRIWQWLLNAHCSISFVFGKNYPNFD